MTDRLEEIEQRVAKATPGPWTTFGTAWIRGFNVANKYEGVIEPDNYDFIVHSRADIPYLLARLRAAEAVVESYLDDLGGLKGQPTLDVIDAWEAAKAETVKP